MKQDVKYIVLKEQKLVVCEIIVDSGLKFRAVAKCSPNDVFDEEAGKHIAFLRADSKCRRNAIMNIRDEQIKYLDFVINEAKARKNKYEKIIKKQKIFIADNMSKISKIANGKNI